MLINVSLHENVLHCYQPNRLQRRCWASVRLVIVQTRPIQLLPHALQT